MKVAIFLGLISWVSLFSEPKACAQDGGVPEKRFTVAPLAEGRIANTSEIFVIAAGEHRFSLRAPLGWSVFYDQEARTVTLRRSQSELTIKFEQVTGKNEVKDEFLEALRKRYQDLQVLDEPPLMAFSKPAASFDLRWTHTTGAAQAGRFARVAWKDLQVEFALVCPPEQLDRQLATLMQIMATMRASSGPEQLKIRSFGVE
jgi:hypothetical protein